MAQLPFTTYANIYAHPSGTRHQAIAGIVPYKSGLTPLSFPPNATTQQVREIRKLEDYQIGRFEGELYLRVTQYTKVSQVLQQTIFASSRRLQLKTKLQNLYVSHYPHQSTLSWTSRGG